MERLTEDSVTGETYIKHCASSCPYDGDFCGTDECPVLNAVSDKLGEYERAEEQDLLVRLPCKVGDIVYVPTRNFISELRITMASINNRGKLYFSWVLDEDKGIYPNLDGFSGCELGKTVFLTREEAEKKLEEMKNDGSKK